MRRRDETRETREGSRSEVPIFRASNPELRIAPFSHISASRVRCRAAGRPFHYPANVQSYRTAPSQMRDAKGLLEGLPCPRKFRDIQDILSSPAPENRESLGVENSPRQFQEPCPAHSVRA